MDRRNKNTIPKKTKQGTQRGLQFYKLRRLVGTQEFGSMACSKSSLQSLNQLAFKPLSNCDYATDQIKTFSQKISLVCTLCNGILKNRMILPCFHTLDSICPLSQIASYDRIICYACLQKLKVHNLSTFIPNIIVNNCLVVIQSNPGLTCRHCKGASTLVAVCLNCENFLCWECSQSEDCGFKKIHFLRDLNTFCQAKNIVKQCIQVFTCVCHSNRNYKFYCTVCNVPMCERCIQDQTHKSHEFELLSNIESEKSAVLNKLIHKKRNEMSKVYLGVEKHLDIIQKQFESIKLKIFACTGISCSGNEDEIKKWLSMLHEIYFNSTTNISEQLSNIKATIYTFDLINIFNEGLEKFVNSEHKLVFKTLVETTLKIINPLSLVDMSRAYTINFISESLKILNHIEKNFNFPFGNCCAELQNQKALILKRCFDKELVCFNLSLLAQTANVYLNNDQGNLYTAHETRGLPNCYNLFMGTAQMNNYPAFYNSYSVENFDQEYAQPLDRSVLVIKSKLFNNPVFLQRKTIKYVLRFGSTGKGEGEFSELCGIAISNHKNLIIPDSNNHRIQVFNFTGKFLFSFGHDNTKTSIPNLVAVNRNTGNIVISERAPSHEIKVYDRLGKFLYRFGESILLHPRAIDIDNEGRLIVVESKIKKVTIFTEDGQLYNRFNCTNVEFPISVAVNKNENIFIADNKEHCIKVFNYHGQFLRVIGCKGITDFPIAIRISDGGDIVIADNHDYLKFTVYKQNGCLVTGYSSKIKQNQCLDFAFINESTLAITCMDNQVYIYNYPNLSFT